MDITKFILSLPPVLRRHKLVKLLTGMCPGSKVQLVPFNSGAKVYADLTDDNARQYLLAGVFEPEFFSIAAPFLAEGGIFFDVGANFGFCSFGLMDCLPGRDVDYHLFEANPEIVRLLKQSALLHEDCAIKVNNCCVSDKPGESMLHVVEGRLGQSYVSGDGTVVANNLLLDEYIEGNSIQAVSFMKMDIEGYEPLALSGAYRSLSSGKIKVAYVEISDVNLARNGFVARDVLDILVGL